MSPPDSSVRRLPSAADLPKLPAPLPLQLRSETGSVIAKVRWMDTREMLFWCVPRVAAGRDILARLALSPSTNVDLTLRVLEGESPVRSGDGHVHVARWIGLDDAVRDQVLVALRDLNPAAFAADYRHPRPPRAQDRAAAAAAKKAAADSAMDRIREEYATQLADRVRERTRAARRIRYQALLLFAIGIVAGATGILSIDGFQRVRVAVWRVKPEVATKYGLMENISLPGYDFVNRPLAGSHFAGATLTGSSVRGQDARGTDFGNADLRRADFRGAKLGGANLTGASVVGTSFVGAELEGAVVATSTDLGDFSRSTYDSSTVWGPGGPPRGALGPKAEAAGAKLAKVTLAGKNLAEIVLNSADIAEGDFGGADLRGARFAGAHLSGVKFVGAMLEGAVFSSSVCESCSFAEAKLKSSNFGSAQAPKADFTGADLSGLSAEKGVFADGLFQHAVLVGAQLGGAAFDRADLSGADLSGAVLFGASFAGAKLDGAKWVGAVGDDATVWPEGFAGFGAGVLRIGEGTNVDGSTLPVGLDVAGRALGAVSAKGTVANGLLAQNVAAPGGNFARAMLADADFSGALLKDASFAGAHLERAHFQGARLENTHFEDAHLCGADLSTAQIAGAKFKGAVACAATRWPGGRIPEGVKGE